MRAKLSIETTGVRGTLIFEGEAAQVGKQLRQLIDLLAPVEAGGGEAPSPTPPSSLRRLLRRVKSGGIVLTSRSLRRNPSMVCSIRTSRGFRIFLSALWRCFFGVPTLSI
jgi:hypothetical protein